MAGSRKRNGREGEINELGAKQEKLSGQDEKEVEKKVKEGCVRQEDRDRDRDRERVVRGCRNREWKGEEREGKLKAGGTGQVD